MERLLRGEQDKREEKRKAEMKDERAMRKEKGYIVESRRRVEVIKWSGEEESKYIQIL